MDKTDCTVFSIKLDNSVKFKYADLLSIAGEKACVRMMLVARWVAHRLRVAELML
jgi:hypothetical protein